MYEEFFNLEFEEKEENYFDVFKLALQKNLSFYDASYITLAKEMGLRLLTLDTTVKM